MQFLAALLAPKLRSAVTVCQLCNAWKEPALGPRTAPHVPRGLLMGLSVLTYRTAKIILTVVLVRKWKNVPGVLLRRFALPCLTRFPGNAVAWCLNPLVQIHLFLRM